MHKMTEEAGAILFDEWLKMPADCLATEEMESFIRFAEKNGCSQQDATQIFYAACEMQSRTIKELLSGVYA